MWSPATRLARANWENTELNVLAGLEQPYWAVLVAARFCTPTVADVEAWAQVMRGCDDVRP